MTARNLQPIIDDKAGLQFLLSDLIMRHHWEFMWKSNGELQTLFWSIGSWCKRDLKPSFNSAAKLSDGFSNSLSERLTADFGAYFEQNTLDDLMAYVTVLSDTTPHREFNVIDWDYIHVLLTESATEAWLFYLQRITKHRLTPDELREEISSDLFSKWQSRLTSAADEKEKPFRKKSHSEIVRYEYKKKPVIGNLYKAPKLAIFQRLMQPKAGALPVFDQPMPERGVYLIKEIYRSVAQKQNSLARYINTRFNWLMQDIGVTLKRTLAETDEQPDPFIEDISRPLVEQFGQTFNAENLKNMMAWVDKLRSSSISTRISDLLTWGHIVLLLPLAEREEIMFYARIAAADGLSPVAMQQAILAKTYQNTPGAKELEKETIRNMLIPILKKGLPRVTSWKVDLGADVPKGEAVANLFTNQYFMTFMQEAGEWKT